VLVAGASQAKIGRHDEPASLKNVSEFVSDAGYRLCHGNIRLKLCRWLRPRSAGASPNFGLLIRRFTSDVHNALLLISIGVWFAR
jgi:hypothetical protein